MGVNTGPMGLCWLNGAHPLRHPQDGARRRAADLAGVLSGARLRAGRSLPFASPTQELVWQDDTLEAIQRAFTRIAERLESKAQDA